MILLVYLFIIIIIVVGGGSSSGTVDSHGEGLWKGIMKFGVDFSKLYELHSERGLLPLSEFCLDIWCKPRPMSEVFLQW